MNLMVNKLEEGWVDIVTRTRTNTIAANSDNERKDIFSFDKWDYKKHKYVYAIMPSTARRLIKFSQELMSKNYQLGQFTCNQITHFCLDELASLISSDKKANFQNLLNRIRKEKDNLKVYVFKLVKCIYDLNSPDLNSIVNLREDIQIGKICDLLNDNALLDWTSLEMPNFINQNSTFIAVKVYGKSDMDNFSKAIVKAQQFTNLINYFGRYFQGEMEPIHVLSNVENNDRQNINKYFIMDEKDGWSSHNGFNDKQNLGFLTLNQQLIDKIRRLINLSQNNELFTRVEQSVNWLGKSLIENNYSDRLLDTMIAFECVAEHKNKYVGIVEQLTNFVTYILGTNDKTLLKEKINHIYSTRSKIVHNGFSGVTGEEYWDLYGLVSKLVNELLKNPTLDDNIWNKANNI